MQKHGERYIWVNSPAIPCRRKRWTSFAWPLAARPAPGIWRRSRIPAYEMIRFDKHYARLSSAVLLLHHRA
ncbi:hypothetical protein DMH17_06140 [Raoultella planticola]|nr:hypothetical protein [Raoultella planticola]